MQLYPNTNAPLNTGASLNLQVEQRGYINLLVPIVCEFHDSQVPLHRSIHTKAHILLFCSCGS